MLNLTFHSRKPKKTRHKNPMRLNLQGTRHRSGKARVVAKRARMRFRHLRLPDRIPRAIEDANETGFAVIGIACYCSVARKYRNALIMNGLFGLPLVVYRAHSALRGKALLLGNATLELAATLPLGETLEVGGVLQVADTSTNPGTDLLDSRPVPWQKLPRYPEGAKHARLDSYDDAHTDWYTSYEYRIPVPSSMCGGTTGLDWDFTSPEEKAKYGQDVTMPGDIVWNARYLARAVRYPERA